MWSVGVHSGTDCVRPGCVGREGIDSLAGSKVLIETEGILFPTVEISVLTEIVGRGSIRTDEEVSCSVEGSLATAVAFWASRHRSKSMLKALVNL